MRKPTKRLNIPARNNYNNKKRLYKDVTQQTVRRLIETVKYVGSPKHKRSPSIFGLEPFNGVRGDAALCDEHASFGPADMARIPRLIIRGLNARLIGSNLWTVDESGWIFEGSLTNVIQSE